MSELDKINNQIESNKTRLENLTLNLTELTDNNGSQSDIDDIKVKIARVNKTLAALNLRKTNIQYEDMLGESYKSIDFMLNESSYEYGCLMLRLDTEYSKIVDQIDPDDIIEVEDEPHITILYGLHSDEITDSDVKQCTSGINPTSIKLKIGNVSLFENDRDVLKFDIVSDYDVLTDINSKTVKLPHTTNFPDYHPHSTIAYLKSGTGKKYAEMFKSISNDVNGLEWFYSKPGENNYITWND